MVMLRALNPSASPTDFDDRSPGKTCQSIASHANLVAHSAHAQSKTPAISSCFSEFSAHTESSSTSARPDGYARTIANPSSPSLTKNTAQAFVHGVSVGGASAFSTVSQSGNSAAIRSASVSTRVVCLRYSAPARMRSPSCGARQTRARQSLTSSTSRTVP